MLNWQQMYTGPNKSEIIKSYNFTHLLTVLSFDAAREPSVL